jgi:hypothetical protein
MAVGFFMGIRPSYVENAQFLAEAKKTRIAVGSLYPLMREVLGVAEVLNIPLRDGVLSDDTAARIRQSESLFAGDAPDPNNDYRSTWLVVHEGVRLAISNNVALSLAG